MRPTNTRLTEFAIKAQNIQRGPDAPWHKAAFQVISFDADRKAVGHSDVVLMEGTHDWTHVERTVLLSRAVAFVAIRCWVWGRGVKGTVWFDDLQFQLLDDPKTLPHRPLCLDRATVRVDLTRDLGPFRHLWTGSDVGYMDRVTTPTQVNAMKQAKTIGFRYLRMHDCIFNPKVYSEDKATGRSVYRWETFDRRIQTVLDQGMWPVLVLETMPVEIAGRFSGRNWTNPYPPANEDGYCKWQQLVYEVVHHCQDTWGEDIHQWYFEVWNEPDANGYFHGTREQYLKIYDHAVAGAVQADPRIRIGGPGGASWEWNAPLLKHCHSGRNAATGGTGCRIDFLSWHIYTVSTGIPVFPAIDLSLQKTHEVLRRFPDYHNLPLIVTEWGCASSSNPVHDRPYDAAFRTMGVSKFLDAGITLALPFSLASGPPHTHEGFQGDLALLTKTTIPKPSFRAFELLDAMVGRRVASNSSNDPVGALACWNSQKKRVWVMLYNLVEQYQHQPFTTQVTVQLTGLPSGSWRCIVRRIAPGQCDPFQTWQELGSPKKLTSEQWQALYQTSRIPSPVTIPIRNNTIRLSLPGFSVAQLELMPTME